jgi:hypothetical protein
MANAETLARPRTDVDLDALRGVMRGAPFDRLDLAIRRLKRSAPSEEVRKAFLEVVAKAPSLDFEKVKRLYLKHFGHATR